MPTGAQLFIDLLSADGSVLLEDVASGASLASVDARLHQAVRLRARLSAGAGGARPGLFSWGITWQGATSRTQVFLPLIAR